MIFLEAAGTRLLFQEKTLRFTIIHEWTAWNWEEDFQPSLETKDGNALFQSAKSIRHELLKTGLGSGVLSRFSGFTFGNVCSKLAFETFVWIEEATGFVYFQWRPICEDKVSLTAIYWPGPMDFYNKDRDWYTLLNIQQGLLIPNDWDQELGELLFDGRFCCAGNYMPWFSQIRQRAGYLAICEQPWDSRLYAEHPGGGPYTRVGVKWGPSLGKIRYCRSIRYSFLSDCDYNDICKQYRDYVKEQGLFCTLEEKSARVPLVDRLIGSSFLHLGIKNHVNPQSEFYDPGQPDKYERVVPFSDRSDELLSYYRLGFEKLYLHLDGWGAKGYDNGHPDYLPACPEAGGYEGLKALAHTARSCGYLFGLHDQYRDYYFDAETFDSQFGCLNMDGSITQHSRWAGGHQAILCASQAPYYVKRNFLTLSKNGIRPDCAYLDVFTCNEGDECSNPRHPMTREDCFRFRSRCFDLLLSLGILPSSEEVSDWSMKNLVFCHYAPYEFMMHQPGTPKKGVAVPLFNLVYHDCVIQPWMMEKMNSQEDYMLYALLNGGAPYLIRDGAYPGIDGSFVPEFQFTLEEAYERCKIVAELHEQVAKKEMISHCFPCGDYNVQKTRFAGGIAVTIDLKRQEYVIEK